MWRYHILFYVLGESRIVMVLDKVSKQCRIPTIWGDCVDHVIEIRHAPARGLERIQKGVISGTVSGQAICWCELDSHGVVHDPVHIILVRAGIRRVPMEDFTNAVDPSGINITRPEILLNVLDGIDAEPIHCAWVSLEY
jgi:hypothetical protein